MVEAVGTDQVIALEVHNAAAFQNASAAPPCIWTRKQPSSPSRLARQTARWQWPRLTPAA